MYNTSRYSCDTQLARFEYPCDHYADLSAAIIQPVLILGGDSILALEFCKFLKAKQITFFRTSRKPELDSRTLYLDSNDVQSIENLITAVKNKKIKFGSVVNFIAQVDRKNHLSIFDSHKEFLQIVETNLVFPYVIFKALLPVLKKRAKIVQISGGGASQPIPGLPAYSATKAGLVRLIETIAISLQDKKIDINALGPGPFVSPVFESVRQKIDQEIDSLDNNNKEESLINLHNTCTVIARMISEEFHGITGNFFSAQWDDWSELATMKARHSVCNNNFKLRRVMCSASINPH